MKGSGVKARGFTLLEMLVVVAIMVALAGIALMSVDTTVDSAFVTVTHETMRTLRDAIKGTVGKPGYFSDVGISPDFKLDDLTTNPFASTDPLYIYNPATRKGWRGPYVSFAQSPPLDGWRKEIKLQRKSLADYTKLRLVSGGSNGIIEIDPANSSDPHDASYVQNLDDVVFLLTKDGVQW